MRAAVTLALALALVVWTSTAPAAAAARTAADTIAMGSAADGSQVVFEGEAVGEALRAGDGHMWVNVLSGGMALGVYMPASDARRIERFGAYQRTGDTVRVTGVVNAGCDDHGGDFDVHSSSVEVIAAGSSAPERPELWQLAASAAFLALSVRSLWRYRRGRREYETI